MRLFRRSTVVAVLALTALLTAACGDIEPSARAEVRVEPEAVTMQTTTSTIDHAAEYAAIRAAQRQNAKNLDALKNAIAWGDAIARAKMAEAVNAQVRAGSGRVSRPPAAAPIAAPADIAAVMACIRAHESGDYTIHNHGYSGSSGAYQYLRGTWLSWSARAGLPGYDAAWLAPPAVQDAVTVYALTHGGAGNWSMRWGNDPCTRGLPGGG